MIVPKMHRVKIKLQITFVLSVGFYSYFTAACLKARIYAEIGSVHKSKFMHKYVLCTFIVYKEMYI